MAPRCNFAAWARTPHARVAVIGASGWIGMALVDAALKAGLPAERLRAFTAIPCLLDLDGVEVQTQALGDGARLGDGEWLVLHAAIIGPDRVESGDLTELRARNDLLLDRVFGLADGAPLRRLVVMSSGAAGRTSAANPAKAAYARMKREHEDTVTSFGESLKIPILLPRVFNLGGPFINHVRNYALGDFILSLAKEGRVAIGAADPVFRNYVHVQELAGLLLDLAVDEAVVGEPFDIGGTEAIELGALALRVAIAMGVAAPVIERPAPAGGAGDWYVGDGRAYQTALFRSGRTPVGLDRIIADTAAYLKRAGAI